MFKFKRVGKNFKRQSKRAIEEAADYGRQVLNNRSDMASVKSVMEEIKSIASRRERLKEIKLRARQHAARLKELDAKRHLLEKSVPTILNYDALDPKLKKRADKVYARLVAKLTLKKFIKDEGDTAAARSDRERVLNDILDAKKHDLRRFQDIARHYHEKFDI